ncbi:ABC transporter permease [Plantibacter sp. VKM Ac-2885]|nr:ABC transporter permease [Plantibacter sp. VKM Ac-2885]
MNGSKQTGRSREHRASLFVATVSSFFGVALLMAVDVESAMVNADGKTGGSSTVTILLALTATIFVALAVYVGSIVTVNTFATIVAGRTRTIALLRLIGSTAQMQRRSVSREGAVVGAIGSLAGLALGLGSVAAMVKVGVATRFLPALDYPLFDLSVLLPVLATFLVTWLASWVGARRVLAVTPLQALGEAEEQSWDEASGNRARRATSWVLFTVGILLLLGGAAVGVVDATGVLIGVVGGLISFTGLIVGATIFMPPVLRLVGRLFGSSAPARLAAENALRYPERSSRTTVGLTIGVTLITMFAVAGSTFQQSIVRAATIDPDYYSGIDEIVGQVVAVFSVLIGFSALIAAAGMVNSLSLSVIQRKRELGLLRALGFSAGQIRRMILVEAAQLTIAAVAVGLALGVFYGWAGAQSMLASQKGMSGLVVPAMPWGILGVIVVLAAALTAVAALGPSQRATRVSPVSALASE